MIDAHKHLVLSLRAFDSDLSNRAADAIELLSAPPGLTSQDNSRNAGKDSPGLLLPVVRTVPESSPAHQRRGCIGLPPYALPFGLLG